MAQEIGHTQIYLLFLREDIKRSPLILISNRSIQSLVGFPSATHNQRKKLLIAFRLSRFTRLSFLYMSVPALAYTFAYPQPFFQELIFPLSLANFCQF